MNLSSTKRKTIWQICLLFSFISVSVQTSAQISDSIYTFKAGRLERTYYLHKPIDLAEDAPLVFVLHGYGGNARFREHSILDSLADQKGFVVCYPQGIKDGRGKTCWNVGYPFQEDMTVDDVDFLCKLARHLQKKYQLSKVNTFCTGLSNGGEMCYLLAYEKPDVFSAVAPIAGLTLVWMNKTLKCRKPISLFEVHGTEDRTSEWCGDPTNKGGWGAYMAVPLAVGYWAAQNHCTYEVTDTLLVKKNKNDHYVITHKYMGGDNENEVWPYEVVNGKHGWALQDLNTFEEIWSFFERCMK